MSCDRFPTYSKLLLVVAVVFRCLFLLVLFPRSSRKSVSPKSKNVKVQLSVES